MLVICVVGLFGWCVCVGYTRHRPRGDGGERGMESNHHEAGSLGVSGRLSRQPRSQSRAYSFAFRDFQYPTRSPQRVYHGEKKGQVVTRPILEGIFRGVKLTVYSASSGGSSHRGHHTSPLQPQGQTAFETRCLARSGTFWFPGLDGGTPSNDGRPLRTAGSQCDPSSPPARRRAQLSALPIVHSCTHCGERWSPVASS